MTFFGFTPQESIPYLALLALSITILVLNYRKGFREVWSPLNITIIIFGYYCLLGPYQAVSIGRTTDRLLNMRPFYVSAFWGAFISLLFIVIGFTVSRKKGKIWQFKSYSDETLFDFGQKITLLGLFLFTLSTGGRITSLLNPFNAEAVETAGGSIANYLSLSLNFMIPGVCLLFAYFIKTKKGFWWFIILFFVAMALFTTMGFRFRIVLLVSSMTISYYLIKRKRPNLLVILPSLFVFISLMGLIGKTRNYGRGLDLNRTDKVSKSYYAYGLEEALIFQTSGAVIDLVPEKIPYAGFTPIISTLLFPIPRVIYVEKNSADYVFNALDAIYSHRYSKGAAFMMYAEHFLAFGWLGLMAGSFIIGWMYKRLWLWYLANWQNPFVVVIYASTVAFLYVIMSRGYLPQVTMLFFFSVYPVYFAWWLFKRKSRIRAAGSGAQQTPRPETATANH